MHRQLHEGRHARAAWLRNLADEFAGHLGLAHPATQHVGVQPVGQRHRGHRRVRLARQLDHPRPEFRGVPPPAALGRCRNRRSRPKSVHVSTQKSVDTSIPGRLPKFNVSWPDAYFDSHLLHQVRRLQRLRGQVGVWWWALFNLVGSIVLDVVSNKLSAAFLLTTLLPYLAVTARRPHDTERTGWLQLIGFIPVVGWIIVSVQSFHLEVLG